MKARGPPPLHEGGERAPLPRGPHVASPTPTPTPYIVFRGEKNHREEFFVFYDMEPPPSLKTSREG